MNELLDQKHRRALYWWGTLLYFALFSFNALATSILAALVGAKWGGMTGQEHFLIVVAVLANWTGLVIVFVQRSLARIMSGQPPIETGDTKHYSKA